MLRILSISFVLFLFGTNHVYAGFTSPVNGISTTGTYTVMWQGNPMDYGVSASANSGTPLYRLTEQKLNSGIPPVQISLNVWTASSASFSGKAPGQYVYTYSERICTVSGCTYFAPPDGRLIVTVGSAGWSNPEPTEPATSVGSTAYSADVNSKGEAVVTIPIEIPAGTAGMQPALSLSFSSRSLERVYNGNTASGWLGFGWGMSGISVINRCTMGEGSITVNIKPGDPSAGTMQMRPRLQYNDTDKLCLDGQLLKLVSGVHLQVGAQYRTANESFRLVTLKGTNVSPWFEVRNPNGSTAIYGKANNSKIQKITTPSGSTKTPYFAWSIDEELDSFGNKVLYWYAIKDEAFSYQSNKQRIYPDSIQYSGGSIIFQYQYMSLSPNLTSMVDDGASAGIDRYRFQQDSGHQLTKVTVHNHSDGGFKSYSLIRNDQTAQHIKSYGRQLSAIQECATIEESNSLTCLTPITFKWIYHPLLDWHEFQGLTDSLGAKTEFQYSKTECSYSLSGPSCSLNLVDLPFTKSTLFPEGKKSSTTVVSQKLKWTALSPDDFHLTQYRYFGHGDESLLGSGFLGFRALLIYDAKTGHATYRQFGHSYYETTGSLPLVAEHVYSSVFTNSSAKLISKMESRVSGVQFSFSNGATTQLPVVDQITSFNYENGIVTGIVTKKNTYSIDANSNVISAIESTSVTGAESDAVINFVPYRWGDVPTYTVTGSKVKSTHRKITTLGNVSSATDWRIGYTTREENQFYNGVIGGAGVDSKIQFVDYAIKPGTTVVETETRFTNDPEYHLKTTYGYSGSGQPSSVTVAGQNVESRTQSINYFNSNIVPTSTTNTYGHVVTSSDFDKRFGLPRTITDENGLVSSRKYDAFGRLQLEVDVNGSVTTQNFVSCAASYCETVEGKLGSVAPVYYKEIISHTAPKTREYYDSLGRVIRFEKDGFLAGEVFRTDAQYDEWGREYKISLPYKAGESRYYVVKSYDSRGRTTKIEQPNGGIVETQYGTEVITSGENWLKITTTQTVKKADGSIETGATSKTVSYFNSSGLLVRVVNAQGSALETTTTYEYDALGNNVNTTVNAGSDGTTVSTAMYDKAGMRISMTDPNTGTITSKYTALGELRQSTDAKGTITTYTYDRLGRIRTRNNSIDGTYTWNYDPLGAKGLLSSITNNQDYTRTYFYQDANRAARLSRIETAITIAGTPGAVTKTFTESFSYDIYGRPQKTTSPSGYAITENYNIRGYRSNIQRGDNWYGLVYTNKVGPFGIEEESIGGIPHKRSYDPKSGQLAGILIAKAPYTFQKLDYQWYSNGSLQRKTDSKSGTAIIDTYTYDAHDRLTKTVTEGGGSRTQNQNFDKKGNITSITSTVGADLQVTGYGYTSGRPHAVSNATIKGVATVLGYDQNGAVISYDAPGATNDKYIKYNSINQPTNITVGGSSINDVNATATEEIRYAPDGSRYYKKSTYIQNGVKRAEHTYYVGNFEATYYDTNFSTFLSEKTTFSNLLHIRKTPYVGAVTEVQQFIFYDHLGSVNAITNGSGSEIIAQLAFEPSGVRRDSVGLKSNVNTVQLSELLSKSDLLSSRGFTGHENLDRTGFIHMNGRVYDPQLARFLSPDPLVQTPTNSQSWNRYSYVFNNPLKYTDPSGYQAKGTPTTCTQDGGCISHAKGCDEKCQREGNARLFMQMVTMSTNRGETWAEAHGTHYNIANIQGMTLFALAQGSTAGAANVANSNSILNALRAASLGARPGNPWVLMALALSPTKMGDGTLTGNDIRDKSKSNIIVIGEGQIRVTALAKSIKAEYFKLPVSLMEPSLNPSPELYAKTLAYNIKWINEKMDNEYIIYDLGRDGRAIPSEFYGAEISAIKTRSYPYHYGVRPLE